MQSSGPHSDVKDEEGRYRPTYITFGRGENREWHYTGLCYSGEDKNRVAYKSSLDQQIEAAWAALVAQNGVNQTKGGKLNAKN